MNSWLSMGVGGVVPALGQIGRAAVELDPAADEQQPLGDVLDRAELVRDVEDRSRRSSRVEPGEQSGERVLRVGVDAGGRLVEDQEPRLGAIALAMNARCCWPAGQRRDRLVCLRGQADARDRGVDGAAVVGRQRPEQTRGG